MRNYYKPRNLRKRVPTQRLEREFDPWEMLRLFVEENAGAFSFDDLSDLLGVCLSKSVSRYLEVSARLDSYAQMYTGEESYERVFAHRQASCLLKKYPFRSSDLMTTPKHQAIKKWLSAEEKCKDTNERIRHMSVLPRWVHLARRICSDVLSDLTPSLIMSMITHGKHGPGSTLSNKGNRTTPYYKFMDLPYSCTESARLYAYAAISADPQWVSFLETRGRRLEIPPLGSPRYQVELTLFENLVDVVDSDKVTFVPKDAKTHRPISVGSSMNTFMQLGVKTYMQERLALFGVDLSDQTKNQRLACLGSRFAMKNNSWNENQYATIDLESASDTLSISCVELILDPLWFGFLDDLRHKTSVLENQVIKCEKFSAMGNGFTFPLESLIFYCVAKATLEDLGLPSTSDNFAIYGDDIIVRLKAAAPLVENLKFLGFSTNLPKSFLCGWFKESCGADFYKGTNVRPFYLKREVLTYADIYHTANSLNLKNIESRYPTGYVRNYSYLASFIPTTLRSFGPLELSECYFAVTSSFMGGKGLRPFLSLNEKEALLKAKLMSSEDVDIQSMYAVYTNVQSIAFRARQDVMYMIALRDSSIPSSKEQYPKNRWLDVTDSRDSRFTSRRETFRYVTQVRPVLNWNGEFWSCKEKSLETILIAS